MKKENNKTEKIDRPEGEFGKQFKLAYDISSMPKSMDVVTFTKLCDAGYVFYDSERGNRPKLYQTGLSNGKDVTIPQFVDAKGKEVDISDFTAKMEDEEYWRKEIYKAKQSPLYYFSNYAATSAKPSQEECDTFLSSIGFGATNDSGTADEVNEATRKIREKFAETITIEKLKSLRPVRDRMDAEYETETFEFVTEFGKKFDISATHDSEIKKQLVTKLMKVKPSDAPDKLKYYLIEKSGRWDKALLRAEEIDVLIRLWRQL